MVSGMLELRNPFGGLVTEKVESALRTMMDGDILALHIRGQNAGLVVRRFLDQYSFESFEVSPTNEAVIGTRGRLRRCFPGPAMAIGQDRMADASFRKALAELLAKLDAETPEEVLPTVRKARSEVVEIRDTAHPRFVTQMLTGILRAVGEPFDCPRIYKHMRDDVLWKDALKPWRRSPLWLFLRVILQTSLMRNDEIEEQHVRYKSFMLFFMAHILQGALEASLPSDLLFVMTAKISRRALKLGAVDRTAWLQRIETVMGAVQQELTCRWHSLETNADPLRTQPSWIPSQLSFSHDTKLTLSKLGPYLAKVAARAASPSTRHRFTSANCSLRFSQSSLYLPDPSLLIKMDKAEVHLYLSDLELWVQDCLPDWLRANLVRKDACTALAEFIGTYTSAACSTYMDAPEDISVMLLTLMELWVALDQCAANGHPLLLRYDPEFPSSVFEPLLLPKKSQMERLFRVEQYVSKRRAEASLDSPSIFRSVDTAKSFAVRYFELSPHHQDIRQKIEAEAENERSRKLSEFAKKRQQYHALMHQSNGLNCQYVTRWRRRRQVSEHSTTCQKCQLISEAGKLSIEVHEWPLPERDLRAKAAVFELDVPNDVSKWRDTTHSILVDMLSVEPGACQDKQGIYTLHSNPGLRGFVKSQAGRLELTSKTKPFVVSHYRSQRVSQANETSICVNNGLSYALYDSKKNMWTEELQKCPDVRKKCTFNLPSGPYRGLQYAVNNTIHTSNEVIASQAKCPDVLTMHEFYAFGTLRSGHRLQWRNIARELTARVLNFGCREVHALVTQAAWQ
ncbi:hypothetical protein MMC08_009029, partial [Hypocenomyce scalaris]|nr:hypothetical protein [Hypocenomyce scalaris]